MFAPSTNNALEATNRVLKDEFTKRQRVSLRRFLKIMHEFVENNGARYKNDLLKFANEPSMSLKLWTIGHQWAAQNVTAPISRSTEFLEMVVPSSSYQKSSVTDPSSS